MSKRCGVAFLFILGAMVARGVVPAVPEGAIEVIRAVGAEGEGNVEAKVAWEDLTASEVGAVPEILGAMRGANGLAANWLRSAVEVIVDREVAGGAGLPVEDLKGFLLDTTNDPEARTFAFGLILKADAAAAEELIPGMVNDPSMTLRRGAVERLLAEAIAFEEEGSSQEAVQRYRVALDAARSVDQIDGAAKGLRELGVEVDLPRQFGFLMHWKVAGPFENTGKAGFDTVFPPEEGVDLEATYEGKAGEVVWGDLATVDEYGIVNLNLPFGMLKEVTGYAYTVFESEEQREVELRLGCKNGWKVWLNGELLFGRDEYHRGMRIDQYRMPASLKKGRNEILVKVCQDGQTQEWTVEWEFQLRVCDATGTAVLAVNRPETPVEKEVEDKRRG